MTFIFLVILSVYTRPSVCKSNISQMTYCCHYQKNERDEESYSQIIQKKSSGRRTMSYLERITKSREEKPSHGQTLSKISKGSSALNSATLRRHLLHSAGEDHPMSRSFGTLRDTCAYASVLQYVHEGNRLQSTVKVLI